MQVQTFYETVPLQRSNSEKMKFLFLLLAFTPQWMRVLGISAALLARFDANATFPRLPFEPIDQETYERLDSLAHVWRVAPPVIYKKQDVDFLEVLQTYDTADYELKGAASCLIQISV